MGRKAALRALKRRISYTLHQRMIEDARRHDTRSGKDPGGQPGNDTVSNVAGSHLDRPALGTAGPGPAPTLGPRPAINRCSRPGLLLLAAQPAGAPPESMWSPARARAADAGRNDNDAGEHGHNPGAQEHATNSLTAKRSRSARHGGHAGRSL